MMNVEQRITELRKTFSELPQKIQKQEANRFMRIINNKPKYLIDAGDVVYQAYSVKGIQKIFENLGKTADRSNIYKVLRGESKSIFGYEIIKIYEGDEDIDEFIN